MNRISSGFLIIETIVAMALFLIIAAAGAGFVLPGMGMNRLSGSLTEAVSYASEGLEAARSIKRRGWSAPFLSTDCSLGCGVSTASGYWSWSGTNSIQSPYTRVVTVADVNRDGGGLIATSGGTLDPNTKRITSTVTWNLNPVRPQTVSLVTYLTNWAKNVFGDWSVPSLEAVFDLTVPNSGHATADAISIAYDNSRVYLGRATSAGNELYIFDVTTPASPTLLGQRALIGEPNDIVVSGSYAYIASTDNSTELQIVDVSDPTTIGNPGKLTTVDLTNANSGNNNADGIALSLSSGYLCMVRNGGDELLIFDLTTPASPGAPVGRLGLTGIPTDIAVIGNTAYITSDDNAQELQTVDITTKTLPVALGNVNLNSGNNNANALSVSGYGSTVFVGRASSAAPELYAFSVAVPAAPSLLSTLELGANARSLDADQTSGYVFTATDDNALDLKIINASNPSAMALLGQLNIDNSPLRLVYSSTQDRVFVASSSNTEEFQIAKPL